MVFYSLKKKAMKKLFLPILFALLLPMTYSCSSSLFGRYNLTEGDAASAIKQLLELGARQGLQSGAFSRETVMASVFPESVRKTLNTLNQLGLTNEINRFTTTLGTAAEKSAERSIPIFVSGINNMRLTDAIKIIKNGGTAGTDYLRLTIGDSLRRSIDPIMEQALQEYNLNQQWDKIAQPLKAATGNLVNLDLSTLMAGMVSEAMFRKIEEKEKQIRTEAASRTTPLLQKVFSRNWNDQ
jgi:hypothetical protein